MQLYLVYWWRVWKLEYIIQFICVQLSLIVIPVPYNCANNFWNKTFSTYSCHSIINDGLYHVFIWSYVCIGRVINYYWWPIRLKSNVFWGFHSWREYVIYPILLSCAQNKGSIFGVAFGRLHSCLPTRIDWIWVIHTGSTSLSWKVGCWNSYLFGVDFE